MKSEQNDKLKFKIIVVFAGIILVVVVLFFVLRSDKPASGSLDEFAQCLTDKGAVMYGADWCPHCKNEKNAFGNSFRLIDYVECPDNPNLCLEKGIHGYPTWIFPDPSAGSTGSLQVGSGQAGKILEGEQGLERLSRESGCPLSAK